MGLDVSGQVEVKVPSKGRKFGQWKVSCNNQDFFLILTKSLNTLKLYDKVLFLSKKSNHLES